MLYRKKKEQSQVKFSSSLKKLVLSSSINWPSNLVKNVNIFQFLTTLTQSQGNIFLFRRKRTVTLH